MKLKSIFSITLGAVLSCCLMACGDDDPVGSLQNPAADVQGTYVGQMVTSYVDPTTSQEVVNTEDGTIVITENDRTVINLSLESASISKSGVANISRTSGGYPFNNKSTDESNTFGVQFTGNILNGACTLTFSEESTVRVGGRPRKVTTTYTFTGAKEETVAEAEPAEDATAGE